MGTYYIDNANNSYANFFIYYEILASDVATPDESGNYPAGNYFVQILNGSTHYVLINSPIDGVTLNSDLPVKYPVPLQPYEHWIWGFKTTNALGMISNLYTQLYGQHTPFLYYDLKWCNDNTPVNQAHDVLITPSVDQMDVSWTNGSGLLRVVFVKQANTGASQPVNGYNYNPLATFGSGTQIGSTGWYCVYNGAGTSVTVLGLSPSTDYIVMVCDYNEYAGFEMYKTSAAANNPNTTTTQSPP